MTSRTSPAVVERVVDHVAQLQPRRSRRTSLAACVLDAIWTIESDYNHLVVPLAHRVLGSEADGPLVAAQLPVNDGFPRRRSLKRFPNEWALLEVARNRQRTSTRNRLTKAKAAS